MRFLSIVWPILRSEFKCKVTRNEWPLFKRDINRHVSSHNASQLKCEDEPKTLGSLITKDEELIESMKSIFPLPIFTIKNYYLNKKFGCDYEFERTGPDHAPSFSCTLRVNSPISREFCGYGRSKRAAESAASLKALSRLHEVSQLKSCEDEQKTLCPLITKDEELIESSQLKCEDKQKTLCPLITKDEELIESMKNVFPLPRSTLKNFYYLLSQNLNKTKFGCDYKFERSGPDHSPSFTCTLRLSGPISREFCGHGRSKRAAENAASLKALSCLHEEKEMNYKGEPRELARAKRRIQSRGKDRIMTLLRDKISFTFPEELLSQVEKLIHKYESEVSPIVMSSNSEEDLEDEEEEGVREDEEEEGVREDEEEDASLSASPLLADLMTGKRLSPSSDLTHDHQRDADMRRDLAAREERGRRGSYPIDDFSEEILSSVDQHPVTIIEGGTGCGKSTQVPQMLLDAWTRDEARGGSKCNVVVAQPRRIATASLADWVAKERGEKIGRCIGYKMRLEDRLLRQRGGIVYYTSGSLREMVRMNPSLEGVSHVIIDEVHERFVDTDLLLLMVKRALSAGSDLRLILMSATARVHELKAYFDTESVINVHSGRPYPIACYYVGDVIDQLYEGDRGKKVLSSLRLEEAAAETEISPSPTVNYGLVSRLIEFIDQTKPEGAVLVFLPGWNDIINLQQRLSSNRDLCVLPLHSRLPRHEQDRVFGRGLDDGGQRMVILSTNIAETSLTIRNVVYVIDTGMQNDARYLPNKNLSVFGTVWIAKANAVQRMGRAGRVQPGEVFRLYDEDTFARMDEFPKPEMLRLPLEAVVLKCKSLFESLDVRSLLTELIESPSALAVEKAVESLVHLRILRFHPRDNYTEILTPLGRFVSAISTSPAFSKALVYSAFLGNADHALNFVSLEKKPTSIFKYPQPPNFAFQALKEHHSSTSDLLAMSRFLGHALNSYDEDERRFRGPNWEEIEDREDQSLGKDGFSGPEQDWNFDFEDENQMLKRVSPERLANVIKIRSMFQRQLRNWLLTFIDSASHRPLDSGGQSGGSKDQSLDEDRLEVEGDFVLEDDRSFEVASTECDPDLVLASFLSSSTSVVKRLSFEKEGGSAKPPLLVDEDGTKVLIHKSCVLSDQDFSRFSHDQLFFSTDTYYSQTRNRVIVRDLSAVPAASVALFYGQDLELIDTDEDSTSVLQIRGTNVTFGLDQRTGSCVLGLRKMWHQILDHNLKSQRRGERRNDGSSGEEDEEQKIILEFTATLNQLISRLLKPE